jgi:hypothetical protein
MIEWPRGTGRMVERWSNQTDGGQNRLTPSEKRWKDRSKTYAGIAAAMAQQWGTTTNPALTNAKKNHEIRLTCSE